MRRNILVINCGSSSLKYQLLDMSDERLLARGLGPMWSTTSRTRSQSRAACLIRLLS